MNEQDECYVCYEPSSLDNAFINTSCACRGTLAIHQGCFKQIGKARCSVCKVEFGKEVLDLLVRLVIEYDDNGMKYAEVGMIYDTEIDIDFQHGESKYYFEDGGLWIWCNYNKNKLSGFFRIYDKNGKLVKESWYK